MTLQVVKQPAPAGYHQQQSSPGVMVFLVAFEVIGELLNPVAEESHLHFWRT
jgi:hypothetical protein